jgi:hypothetical protein
VPVGNARAAPESRCQQTAPASPLARRAGAGGRGPGDSNLGHFNGGVSRMIPRTLPHEVANSV